MKKVLYGAFAFTPVFAFAALENVVGIVGQLRVILGLLIPMAFGLAVLFFFYGVARYISSAGDPAQAAKGKSIMIYGVIGIAVMASLWGLIGYLQNTFGISAGTTIPVPTLTNTSSTLN